MLFDRYGDILTRLEELGARVGELNNRDRQVMQNLLEEQEWLGATLVKRAKFLLEEIDRSFEKLFDWMISFSNLIDRAAGHGGTPADVLRMERMMQEADDLRGQLNRLVPERGRAEEEPMVLPVAAYERSTGSCRAGEPELLAPGQQAAGARREAASAGAISPGNVVETSSPLLPSPVPVLKKVRKKKQNNRTSSEQTQYIPPQELVQSLEHKMAVSFRNPIIIQETKR